MSAFAATGIVVSDLERSVEFYTSVVGMKETQRFDVPDMHLLEVIMSFPGGGGGALVLMKYTDDAPHDYVDIGGKLVFSVDDPVALIEAARAAGCEVIREPAENPGFGILGFVNDLDGYALEVLQLPRR
jgi:lactoylglutathione lyase